MAKISCSPFKKRIISIFLFVVRPTRNFLKSFFQISDTGYPIKKENLVGGPGKLAPRLLIKIPHVGHKEISIYDKIVQLGNTKV